MSEQQGAEHPSSRGAEESGPGQKQTLTVTVFAPNSPDPKEFTWPKTLKVSEAARAAATDFGYSGGDPGLQTAPPESRVLDKNKPLVAEGIRDGDELELLDTAGGV